MEFYPKDYIETVQGLLFAVVDSEQEQSRVLCFLRYIRTDKSFQKLTTEQANRFLGEKFPHFLFYSKCRDTHLHGAPTQEIQELYKPRTHVTRLINSQHRDLIEERTVQLINIFSNRGLHEGMMGVTGSILIGAHNPGSDIDLVIYGRDNFLLARKIIEREVINGTLDRLDKPLWEDAYRRRGASLTLEEFVWHERRKFNKAVYQDMKFDISMVEENVDPVRQSYRKLGFTMIDAVVTEDRYAFDYPARYLLDHSEIAEAVSFTPTYAGQARRGETIEISGFIEQLTDGSRRIVVGSSREAPGEYIKVL